MEAEEKQSEEKQFEEKQFEEKQSEEKQSEEKTEKSTTWEINISPTALQTINPIRSVVESMNIEPNPEKNLIPLSIGDPTIFGNLLPCTEIINAMVESLQSQRNNGYFPAVGCEEARRAIAEYSSVPGAELNWTDVILTSGCSHALDMAMTVLTTTGSNILIPCPGFSLYRTLSTTIGVEIRYYRLLPEQNWEIDLQDLESKIDSKTAAIIYNNPSNPCGSVFSKEHILNILKVAEKHCLPIIADEIYEDIVFPGKRFYPIASLTTQVPILSCRGTTKKFLIPGWRLGWILIYDRESRFGINLRKGLNSLAQRLIGPNSLVQGALPKILRDTPKSFFNNLIHVLKENADYAHDIFKQMPGVTSIMPSGAMYMMVEIDLAHFPQFHSDLQFVERLVAEQSVFCLPGRCFECPGYFRIVLSVPFELLKQALHRIELFCRHHYVYVNGIEENIK